MERVREREYTLERHAVDVDGGLHVYRGPLPAHSVE
jgi:hypothetical protein